MKNQKYTLKDRICALIVAAAMALTWALPNFTNMALAEDVNQANTVAEVGAAGGEAGNESGAVTEGGTEGGEAGGETGGEQIPTAVQYTVNVTDVDGVLSGAAVSAVSKTDTSQTAEAVTGSEGSAVLNLYVAETYTVTVTKNGYIAQSFEVTAAASMPAGAVTMTFADISMSVDSNSVFVGDTVKCTVTNPAEGIPYAWTVTGAGEEPVTGSGTSMDVICTKAGAVNVEVTANGKTAAQTVTVNKKDIQINDLAITFEPEGGSVDKNAIQATVSGFPSDATGTATLAYTYQNKNKTATASLQNGTAVFTLNADAEGVIYGNLSCSLSYAGNEKYNSFSNKSFTEVNYKKTQALATEQKVKIVENGQETEVAGQEITYGACLDKTIVLSSDTIKGRAITYEVDKENREIINVDAAGKITLTNKPGVAKVTVKAAANTDYAAAEMEYYVVAKPAKIEVNIAEHLMLDEISKVYDGSSAITVSANVNSVLTQNGQDGQAAEKDALKITGIKGTLWSGTNGKEDASVASDRVKIMKNSVESAQVGPAQIASWYEITYVGEEAIHAGTTVTRSPLYLGTEDVELTYSAGISTKVEEKKNVVKVVSGFVDGETLESTGITLPNAILDTAALSERYDAATGTAAVTGKGKPYADAIRPNITNANPEGKNYYFVIDEENLGDLTVTQEKLTEEEFFGALNIAAADENETPAPDRLYRPNDNEIYVNGSDEGTTLKFSIEQTSDIEKRYDKVKINIQGITDGFKDAGNGILFDADEGVYTGKIQLVKSRWENQEGGITPQVEMPITIHVDANDPTFQFGEGWTETKVAQDTLTQMITFNHYKNSYYSIEGVAAKDDGKAASGVKSKAYYIWKLGSDNETADITGDDVKTKVEELAKSVTNWTPLDGTSIPVVEAAGGNLEELQGQYVVLVQVSDYVGHAAVYASNGVIIEVENPSIGITGVDSDAYYNDDVPYTISVADKGVDGKAVTAGIDTVTVEIYCDGEITETTTYDVAERLNIQADKKTNGYELEQIRGMSAYTIDSEVIAKDNNSNDVKIVVKACDQAGNVAIQEEQPLKIDTTRPEITVSYDNNDVDNDTYFSEKREMTVQYKERNFDESKAVFNVKAGEKKKEDAAFEELSEFGIGYELVSTVSGETPDDRTITYKLTFDKDNDYEIYPSCTDLAGNENLKVEAGNSKAPWAFTIDQKDPVISVKYYVEGSEVEVSAEEAARLYTQKTVTAKVTVEEHNFAMEERFSESPKQMNLTVEAADEVKGAEVNTEAYMEQANKKTGWTRNIDEYTQDFVFTLDANYSFAFSYTDLAGRTAVYAPHYFTVDDTRPEGKVEYEMNGQKETWWNKFFNLITFNRFSSKMVPVSFESKDTTAGVAAQEYYRAYKPLSREEVEKLPKDEWTEGDGFFVAPDEQFVPYLKVTDKAGNVDYFSSEFAVVVDNTKPEIEITNLSTPRNGIFNGDVTLQVAVSDPKNNRTYSGLERVWYEVTSTGNVENYFQRTLVDNSGRREQGNQTWTGNIVIPANDFNSNDVKVQVHALDFSGNQYSSEIVPLKIDKTAPTIQVRYDLNNPLNGKYYKDVRTATVVVTERNFDESAVRFNITNTDGTRPTISGWSHSPASGVSDSATHTCQVTFLADGDYTFTLNTTDLAGNESNYTQADEFTIDRTIPVIRVSYDNNSAATPGYYNADRTAVITIEEHNFNAAEVNAQITATLQGSGAPAPSVGGWSTLGDTHRASVTFSADADYTFDVNYTDLAGNAAADYTQDSFTVDKTKPEVEFFDIENQSANNGVVAPGVRYSDVNYMAESVDITITGAKHRTETLNGGRTPIANGESIKMNDFAYTEDKDDVYTMKAVIRDKAGNETEKEIRFSVNRFGSNYIFSEPTKNLLKNVYTNEEQDIVVTEINVDTLVFNGISYGLDGTKKVLRQGADYTVKQSGGESSWKEYTYTINKKNFVKEGRYSITIDSEDKATNKMNNKVKESNIDFVIDKTAPTVVITGIEESSYREDARDMTVNVSDNTAVKSIEVLVDGKSAAVYDQTEIEKAGGKIDYTIESASAPQRIEAVAVDMAKNETASDIHEVLVTSNLLIQYVNNTPLLVGSIVAVVVAAGGLFWLLVLKKKDNNKKKSNVAH